MPPTSQKKKEQNFQRRKEAQQYISELKSTLKCTHCDENHPACLEFHHIDPSLKDLEVGKAARDRWGIARIKKEIDKCLVLCSNCHKKEHFNQRFRLSTPMAEGMVLETIESQFESEGRHQNLLLSSSG